MPPVDVHRQPTRLALRRRARAGLVVALTTALVVSASTACSESDTVATSDTTDLASPPAAGPQGADGDTTLVIATTVAPITSIAAAIAGDHATITGIVPEGTNSHTFEPPPSAAEILSEADLVLVNGLLLEEPTTELAEQNAKEGSELIELGPMTITEDQYRYDFSFPRDEGRPNPHLWTNPPMVARYAAIIRDALVERDPDHADDYRANHDAFVAEVDELDRAMRTSFATIPADRRRLLTYHDAYAYFAAEYGFEVVGAIQVSDFEDPTPKEVADLIDQVRDQHVPAIFGSEVFPSPVLEQIGNETGVRYVDVLRDDDLPGEPGDREHSLLGLLRFDYRTVTEALGGDATALEDADLTVAVADRATYPQ